jgi:hypothetical protein
MTNCRNELTASKGINDLTSVKKVKSRDIHMARWTEIFIAADLMAFTYSVVIVTGTDIGSI